MSRRFVPPVARWLLLGMLLFRVAHGEVQLLPPDQTSYGGPFELTDHQGREVTERDFLGDYALLYFGYTHCADMCPTALAKITATLRRLGSDAERIQPLFINIDAEGSTVAELAEYVGYFHPRLLGLTGSAAQVRAAADAYRVYFTIHEFEGRRVISHAGNIFLLGPDGRVLTYFVHGAEPDEMAEAIESILNLPERPGG